MNASNVPGRVLDGIDMGSVEAERTSGALEVPGIQHPGIFLKIACRPLSFFPLKKHITAHINIA